MPTQYPGAVDNFTNPTTADPMNSATVPHAAQHANANDAIEAIETVLGTNPQGTSSTVKDRIIAAEGAILNLNLAINERVPGEAGSNAPGGALPNGYVWVNTTDNSIKVWNGTTWVDPSNAGNGGPAWAVVSGGTVTEYTHPTYGVMQVHTFTGNGTLTVTTPGLADVLVVGGGGSDWTGHANGGSGGHVRDGLQPIPAGSVAVTVGAGGAPSSSTWGGSGGPSSLGTIGSGRVSGGFFGAGAGPEGSGTSTNGVSSNVTGTATEYGKGVQATPRSNRGDGGNLVAGSAGIVIVAVKKP